MIHNRHVDVITVNCGHRSDGATVQDCRDSYCAIVGCTSIYGTLITMPLVGTR